VFKLTKQIRASQGGKQFNVNLERVYWRLEKAPSV